MKLRELPAAIYKLKQSQKCSTDLLVPAPDWQSPLQGGWWTNTAWHGRSERKGKCQWSVAQGKFSSQRTELVLSIQTYDALLALLPNQPLFYRNRKLPHTLSSRLLDEILSQELLSLRKGQAHSRIHSPVSCGLFLLAFTCHTDCAIENFPCKDLTIV